MPRKYSLDEFDPNIGSHKSKIVTIQPFIYIMHLYVPTLCIAMDYVKFGRKRLKPGLQKPRIAETPDCRNPGLQKSGI